MTMMFDVDLPYVATYIPPRHRNEHQAICLVKGTLAVPEVELGQDGFRIVASVKDAPLVCTRRSHGDVLEAHPLPRELMFVQAGLMTALPDGSARKIAYYKDSFWREVGDAEEYVRSLTNFRLNTNEGDYPWNPYAKTDDNHPFWSVVEGYNKLAAREDHQPDDRATIELKYEGELRSWDQDKREVVRSYAERQARNAMLVHGGRMFLRCPEPCWVVIRNTGNIQVRLTTVHIAETISSYDALFRLDRTEDLMRYVARMKAVHGLPISTGAKAKVIVPEVFSLSDEHHTLLKAGTELLSSVLNPAFPRNIQNERDIEIADLAMDVRDQVSAILRRDPRERMLICHAPAHKFTGDLRFPAHGSRRLADTMARLVKEMRVNNEVEIARLLRVHPDQDNPPGVGGCRSTINAAAAAEVALLRWVERPRDGREWMDALPEMEPSYGAYCFKEIVSKAELQDYRARMRGRFKLEELVERAVAGEVRLIRVTTRGVDTLVESPSLLAVLSPIGEVLELHAPGGVRPYPPAAEAVRNYAQGEAPAPAEEAEPALRIA